MVETGGLENRCTGNRTGGSNPSPSAIDLTDLQRLPVLTTLLFPLPFRQSGEHLEDFRSKIPFLNGSPAIAITLKTGQ